MFQLTWCDFVLANLYDSLAQLHPPLFDKFPTLKAHTDMVRHLGRAMEIQSSPNNYFGKLLSPCIPNAMRVLGLPAVADMVEEHKLYPF